MFNLFQNIHIDWLGKRRIFIGISILIMLAGLVSAVGRQLTPGGTDAFNLGVDFKGGTVVTVRFREKPDDEAIRSALNKVGIADPVIQVSTNRPNEVLIKTPLIEAAPSADDQAPDQTVQKQQVQAGRATVKQALDAFGKEAEGETTLESDPSTSYKIIGTDSVGAIAGAQLRNQAVRATVLGCIGILLFIAFRYDWTWAAGGVIAVFHDVLMVLACFSIFQWEVNLTVIAAILTIVGFSINDSINQTLSRTVITAGLVLLSVLSLVLFGGEVLRSFSLALLVGLTLGMYSTIAIASPITIWWQDKLGAEDVKETMAPQTAKTKMASAARKSVTRRPVTR